MTIPSSISQPFATSGYSAMSGYGPFQGYGATKSDLRAPVENGQGVQPAPPGSRQSGTTPPGQEPVSDTQEKNAQNSPSQSNETAPDGSRLTAEELQLVEKLKTADQEVRQHELAHLAAGGSLVTTGAQFTYKTGPDGQRYAVAGEVGIDTSPVPGDPRATMEKMQQIKQAALAPANPSSQDLKVASQAAATAAEAAGELTMLMAKQQGAQNEDRALGSARKAADTYQKVSSLPEGDTHSFQLAV